MPLVSTWDRNTVDIAPGTLSCLLIFCRNFAKEVLLKMKYARSQLRTHGVHSLKATERCSRGCPRVRPKSPLGRQPTLSFPIAWNDVFHRTSSARFRVARLRNPSQGSRQFSIAHDTPDGAFTSHRGPEYLGGPPLRHLMEQRRKISPNALCRFLPYRVVSMTSSRALRDSIR